MKIMDRLINRYKALFDYKSSVKHKYIYKILKYIKGGKVCVVNVC